MDCMEHGPLTGSYARDVRVVVYDGKMHPVDSNELSFTLAARHAFSMAFKEAGPKILEPIYDLEVYVPSDYMGDVMSDLQGRRAIIMGMDAEAGYQKLSAKIPLKELSNYSVALSSLTGGRASFTTKFASYELVPNDIQQKLIAAHEAYFFHLKLIYKREGPKPLMAWGLFSNMPNLSLCRFGCTGLGFMPINLWMSKQ